MRTGSGGVIAGIVICLAMAAVVVLMSVGLRWGLGHTVGPPATETHQTQD